MSGEPESETQTTSDFNKSRWSSGFQYFFEELPERIQKSVLKVIRIWETDPRSNGLKLHPLKDNKKGQHKNGSWAVSVNRQYRAIFVWDGPTALWYWVGTHNDYNRFTGDS